MSITLTKDDTKKMFKKLGATIETGAKHLKATLVVEGKHVFMIPISNGSKDIPTGTAQKIFREAHLSNRKDCEQLRNCPMQRPEYLDILRQQGII
jgi:hypothetical protein